MDARKEYDVDLFDKDMQELVARASRRAILRMTKSTNTSLTRKSIPTKLDNTVDRPGGRGHRLGQSSAGTEFYDAAESATEEAGDSRMIESEHRRPGDCRRLPGEVSKFKQRSDPDVPESDGRNSASDRVEEIAWPKEIEVTRSRFRRTVISLRHGHAETVGTLSTFTRGELPFDEPVKVC